MLDIVEARIDAGGRQQLVVAAMLHESMVVHDEDRVGVEDGSQMVREPDPADWRIP
jgi:hypothetical protein